MRPPPGQRAAISNPITGTGTNAETKPASMRKQQTRALVGRILDHGRRRGLELAPFQVRNVLGILRESGAVAEPTDEQIITALMKAPWHRKPTVKRHGIGGPGWRTAS